MAEVGVLNLTIKDNSEQAGQGLNTLADALTAVKTAVKGGLGGLSAAAGHLQKLSDAVAENSKAMNSIGSLLNAVTAYSKAFKDTNKLSFNAKPIEDLKAAIGDGVKLGNAGTQLKNIRDAMNGEWNTETAYRAAFSMSSIASAAGRMNEQKAASVISKTADALNKYFDAMQRAYSSSGAHDLSQQVFGGMDSKAGTGQMKLNLQLFAEKGVSKTAEQIKMDLDNLFQEVKTKTVKITDEFAAMKQTLADADYAKLDMSKFLPGVLDNLPEQFRRSSEAIRNYQNAAGIALPKIQEIGSEEMLIAGNAREATKAIDNLISRLNATSKVKGLADFVNWSNGIGRNLISAEESAQAFASQAEEKYKPDWVMVKSNIEETVDGVKKGRIETEEWFKNFKRLHDEMAEKYTPNRDQTFEEWYNGYRPGIGRPQRDLMSEWLHGEGTEREQQFALEQTARKFGMTVEEVKQRIAELQELYAQVAQAAQAFADSTDTVSNALINMTGVAGGFSDAFGRIFQMMNMMRMGFSLESGAGPAGYLNDFIEAVGTVSDVESTAIIPVAQVTSELDEQSTISMRLIAALWKLGQAVHYLQDSFGELKGGMAKMFPTLTGLLKRFKSMMIMRTMRYLIRQISAGLSEGVQNVYHYSKAIGSDFSAKMDDAATSLLQFKNSIGAAVAPLLSSLIPVIQSVINWLINGINYINQFFALLNGQQSWTRAIPKTTSAFEKQEKAAKKTGSAIKDLLADWDELNIIQSNSSGAGTISGTSEAEEYLKMFQETSMFDKNIRRIVEFIKDNLTDIERIAAAIGATIFAWKLSNAFTGMIGTLGNLLGAAGTIYITLALTDMFGKNFASTGEPGWFIADALTGAVGAGLAWQFAKKLAGGAAASVTSGITLILASAVNIKNALGAAMQQQVARYGMLTVLAAAESGVGAALIAKGLHLSTAFAFGLGAAAAVATVAISVGALIQMSKDNIEWGEESLTKEEVEAFVQQRMFTNVGVDASITIVKASIEKVQTSKLALQNQVAQLMPTLYSLRLGVDKKNSYEEIQKQIFGDEQAGTGGLIAMIQEHALNNVQELKTSFSIIPVIDESGKDVSAEFLESGISGWTKVDSYVNQLGIKLGKELSKGFTEDGLAKFDEDAVRAITEKMQRISEIITGSQIESGAQADLRMGLNEMDLGDMNKESVEEVLKLFDEYKTKLEQEYTNIYKDSANQFLILSRFYKETGNQGLADYYETQYKDLIAKMPQSVAASVKSAAAPGLNMIYEFMHEKFADVFERLRLNLEGGGSGAFRQALIANFIPSGGDAEQTVKEFNAAMAEIIGNENMFLKGLLVQMPGLNMWDLFDKDQQKDLETAIRGLYGDAVADAILQAQVPVENAVEEYQETLPDVAGEVEHVDTANLTETTRNAEAAKEAISEAADGIVELDEVVGNAVDDLNSYKLNELKLDTTNVIRGVDNMAYAIEQMKNRIIKAFRELNETEFSFGVGNKTLRSMINAVIPVQKKAMGGPVRSGDLVMANENGNFEMMGRMGSQPVVANNQQIVNGISQGVTTANGDVVSELRTLNSQIQKLMSREFVAKAVPSASWGNHNSKSNSAWDRVTGNA